MSGGGEAKYPLFSYGTLRQPEVQLATFGRLLAGAPDILSGYTLGLMEIKDPEIIATSGSTHHLNIVPSGKAEDEVPGLVLEVTEAELAAADAYEDPSDYRRISVTLKSGREVFVYIGVAPAADGPQPR